MMRHEASEVRLAAAFATSGEGSSRNRSSVSCAVSYTHLTLPTIRLV